MSVVCVLDSSVVYGEPWQPTSYGDGTTLDLTYFLTAEFTVFISSTFHSEFTGCREFRNSPVYSNTLVGYVTQSKETSLEVYNYHRPNRLYIRKRKKPNTTSVFLVRFVSSPNFQTKSLLSDRQSFTVKPILLSKRSDFM